jgi:hypothetical protein
VLDAVDGGVEVGDVAGVQPPVDDNSILSMALSTT